MESETLAGGNASNGQAVNTDGKASEPSAAAQVQTEDAAGTSSTAPPGESKAPESEGVKLGYKMLKNGHEALDYFRKMLTHAPKNVDLNEIGGGLAAIQVRNFNEGTTARAFFAIRKDGSAEDFSYVKCCEALFPDVTGATAARATGKRHRDSSEDAAAEDGQHGADASKGAKKGGWFNRGRGRGGRGRGGRS